MRHIALIALLPMMACTDAGVPAQPGLDAEAACAATIAAHIRQPITTISARKVGEANGITTIETVDGGRRHLCTVDAAGRVLGTHTRAKGNAARPNQPAYAGHLVAHAECKRGPRGAAS